MRSPAKVTKDIVYKAKKKHALCQILIGFCLAFYSCFSTVTGIYNCLAWQCKKLIPYAFNQCIKTTSREIGSSNTPGEECISRKDTII